MDAVAGQTIIAATGKKSALIQWSIRTTGRNRACRKAAHNPQNNSKSNKKAHLQQNHKRAKAERTGFEPAEPFRAHRFSKPALSATQPPLRIGKQR